MVVNEIHSVIIDGFRIPADIYLSLLKYILESIKKGYNKKDIVNSLVNKGWKSELIEFLFEVDNFVDKSQLNSSVELKNSSENFVSKEEIERLERELRLTIKDFNKFEGKLEQNESKLGNFSEKISILRENVGEVRGMETSLEKKINNFEEKIEKVNTIIAQHDPKVLEKKFSDIEKKISLKESDIEKVSLKLTEVEKKLDEFLGFMRKIKSYDSLISVLDNINKKVKKIKEIEKDVDKKSGKVESIFLEFQDKLDILFRVNTKIESYDEIFKDLIKDVDNLSIKVKTLMSKEDFAKKIEEINNNYESIKSVVYNINKTLSSK